MSGFPAPARAQVGSMMTRTDRRRFPILLAALVLAAVVLDLHLSTYSLICGRSSWPGNESSRDQYGKRRRQGRRKSRPCEPAIV